MTDWATSATWIQAVLVGLALGLLVGLQREWSGSRIAGIRTFPLLTAFGVMSGLLADHFGGWTVVAGLLALAAMLMVGNLAQLEEGKTDPGLTTELAALLMYMAGVAVAVGRMATAVVVAGSVAVLLQWKGQLHRFARRFQEQDLRAAAQLALVGLVILPALPDHPFGPYGVLNPFQVWSMVVLIVGISLAAYVVQRVAGERQSALIEGVMAGLISSTAATAAYARKHSRDLNRPATATAVIVLASATVFGRLLLEIGIVAPDRLIDAGGPLAAMLVLMIGLATWSLLRSRAEPQLRRDEGPPRTLATAVGFGLLYAVVILAVAAANAHIGNAGMYAVAGLSGLTDVDAITLSTIELIRTGQLNAETGWRIILTASLANLGFKAAITSALGSRALFNAVAPYFATALAGGGCILAIWK